MNVSNIKLSFPWLSAICIILLSVYFLISGSHNPELRQLIPTPFREENVQIAIVSILFLTLLLDFLRFSRKKKTLQKKLIKYDKHLQEVLKSKSNLQSKALTYSNHADKLKLFISDRLLEHIEYDEKFLHFRNIAAEVRHNGVISFDKVRTALESTQNIEEIDKDKISDALHSMRYLWDLLDLSTTDNISMYVANKLYEAEEEYCRLVLDEQKYGQTSSPTYYAYDGVVFALPDFVDKSRIRKEKNQSRRHVYAYDDNKLHFELERSVQLLGNINYFVLLIENLLNNALFYLNSKKYGNKYSRIAVMLRKSKKNMEVSIYNPGPAIDKSLEKEIFQLGFSTRRTKENHGKGLGLYFVEQIVKGNEGEIGFENVVNRKDSIELIIHTEDEEAAKNIELRVNDDDKFVCKTATSENSSLEYRLKSLVKKIEVVSLSSKKKYVLEIDEGQTEAILFQPDAHGVPNWCVEFFKLKTLNKVVFRALDIRGVRFIVKIPTAESRLEVNYHELESEEIHHLENPDVKFDDIDITLYQ